MDPSTQFCPNFYCGRRGIAGQGNIRVHSRKDRRYRCTTCGKTFAAAGRVFLVDFDGETPVYRQKSLSQSPPVTPLQSSADVERLAEAVLKILENQEEETKAFLP
jgi:hypothetical protein